MRYPFHAQIHIQQVNILSALILPDLKDDKSVLATSAHTRLDQAAINPDSSDFPIVTNQPKFDTVLQPRFKRQIDLRLLGVSVSYNVYSRTVPATTTARQPTLE